MSMLLHREIDHLKKNLLSMGAVIEDAIAKAIKALVERDEKLAESVMEADKKIDEMEVQVEEECLKILALHQPVATDLRYVIAVMKMNNDLERMGDLAAHIAKRVIYLSTHEPINIPIDFPTMAEKAQHMVKLCLDSLVNADADLAREVCAKDDEVDDLREEYDALIHEYLQKMPQNSKTLMNYGSIARHLERLGDMATNVAEDVIYMVEGEIIRHKKKTSPKKKPTL